MPSRLGTTCAATPNTASTTRTMMLAAAAWLLCVILGFQILLAHDSKRTVSGMSASELFSQHYAALAFLPELGQMRLVMAIHPKCPCTRNTLDELERLVKNSNTAIRCTFLVAVPNTHSLDWMDTATTRTALLLPNAELIADLKGKQALALGLTASGALLITDDSGKILFKGGITAGRSCVAENLGSHTVASILRHEQVCFVNTPVFGCEIDMQENSLASEAVR